MRVSVIIPTFNRPLSLKRSVDSVLNQSIPPHEVLVVNDGEETETIRDLQAFSPANVRVLNTKGSEGGNAARNLGANEATGEILMFLDDDDYWTSQKIENQIRIFISNNQIGLVYSNRNVVDDDGKYVRRIKGNEEGKIFPQILFSNIIGTTSSVAVKRDVFFQAGAFDLKLTALQDYDLWVRVCKICLVGLDKAYTVNYTVSSDNFQISKSGMRKEESVKVIWNKYKDDISKLSWINRRKVKSNLMFYIARSYGSSSFKKAFSFAFKSFFAYPNVRSFATLLPARIVDILAK